MGSSYVRMKKTLDPNYVESEDEFIIPRQDARSLSVVKNKKRSVSTISKRRDGYKETIVDTRNSIVTSNVV
jgi:hypothetical protein